MDSGIVSLVVKTSSVWWSVLAACPDCGSRDLSWPDHIEHKGRCVKCARSFELDGNILRWSGTKRKKEIVFMGVFSRLLKTFLNPLSCPLLPFRYLTQIRVERFYRRTLSDLDIARKWASHYLRGFALPKKAVVLDFGCGRGRNVGILHQLGHSVVGQDMVAHPWWRKLPNAGFQELKDYSRLPFCDAAFDLVNEVMVLHCIPESQLLKHLQEIKRVLKPGGYWVLLENNAESYAAKIMRSRIGRLYELVEIRKLIVENGFNEIDLSFEGFYAPHFPMIINFLRKLCSPRKYDVSDYNSRLAGKIDPQKRGLWLLRLKRSDK